MFLVLLNCIFYKSAALLFSASRTKPRRPCIFCGQLFAAVHSHQLASHKDEDEIIAIQLLSKADRIAAFGKLRRQGIVQYNKTLVAKGVESHGLMSQRLSGGPKAICVNCSGVFKKEYLYRHKKRCKSNKELNGNANETVVSAWDRVLKGMMKDPQYALITNDATILLIGKHVFDVAKPSKQTKAKIAQTAMRRLARLVQATEVVTEASELFLAENVNRLEEAIVAVCQSDADGTQPMNAALKTTFASLIRMGVKCLLADNIRRKERKEAEVERFDKLFKIKYRKNFANAESRMQVKRQPDNSNRKDKVGF